MGIGQFFKNIGRKLGQFGQAVLSPINTIKNVMDKTGITTGLQAVLPFVPGVGPIASTALNVGQGVLGAANAGTNALANIH